MGATTADWITAVATSCAAVGTVGALGYAAAAAKSASRSATAANESLQAEARPLLLDVPHEHYTDYEHEFPWPGEGMRKTPMRSQILVDTTYGTFVFPVRNVGRGAALIEHFALTLNEVGETYSEYSGVAVPVGEDAWLAARPDDHSAVRAALGRVLSPVHGAMPYILSATYTDIAGKQRQRLELGIGTRGQDSALRVLRIQHVSLTD
jgi:hypothetical protein